jgi:KaiC/GvpD/RAD55 family RecA-like ATPase
MSRSSQITVEKLAAMCGGARESVRLVSRCTRALIQAYFDTAYSHYSRDQSKFLGAEKSFLWNRLPAEELQSSDWETYVKLWHLAREGPYIKVDGDDVVIRGLRGPGDTFRNDRPSVAQVVQGVLCERDALGETAPVLPEDLVTDWYREDICDRYQLDDGPAFLVYAKEWLKQFNAIKQRECLRHDLLGLVSSEQRHQLWAEALVEVLDYLAVIQFTTSDYRAYRLKFKADTGYVLANLFGRGTGVRGLDYLLFGGLWIPGQTSRSRVSKLDTDQVTSPGTEANWGPAVEPAVQASSSSEGPMLRENLSISISGAPGMGKTTLGLAVGVMVASRGGCCVLARFESDTRVFLRQIATYWRSLLPYFQIQAQTGERLYKPDSTWNSQGLMVISDISTGPLDRIRETTDKLVQLDGVAKYEGRERVFIFDSISAAQYYAADSTLWRSFLREMTGTLRQYGFSVVFILEKQHSDGQEVQFDDYLVDLDIRLVTEQISSYPYPFRAIEVAKSRHQASHRGTHVYSIEADAGLRVYPSSAAVLSARGRRELRTRETLERIDPGVADFAKYFAGGAASQGRSAGAVPFWRRSSVTALVGPRGTLKTAFAEVFSRTVDNPGLDSSLSLHFADEFQFSLEIPRVARMPSPFGVRYDFPISATGKVTAGQGGKLGSTLSYVLFRSGYLAPAHVLHTVRQIIAEKRRLQTPIRRAVITDVGNIGPNFPALRADPVFLPALCDLFVSEGITTVLVYSPPVATLDTMLDQVRSVAENVLCLDTIPYRDREYTAIRIERSVDATHDRRVYEIQLSWEGRGTARHPRVAIVPSFDLLLDIHSGAPKSFDTRLLLNAETDLQRAYYDGVKDFLGRMESHRVEVSNHTRIFSRRLVPHTSISARNTLCILDFDACDLGLYYSRRAITSVLCNLPAVDARLLEIYRDLVGVPVRLHGLNRPDPPPSSSDLGLSVPYFLNPSFLVASPEFVDLLGARGLAGDYQWRDLIDAASHFRKENDASLLGGTVTTPEDLNCLFLEILASLLPKGTKDVHAMDFSRCFGPQSAAGLETRQLLVQATVLLRQLLGPNFQSFRPAPADLASGEVTPLSRHWYATYRQLAATVCDGDASADPYLKVLPLPGRVWTNGDWHLGILAGSIGERHGAELILNHFVNRASSLEAFIRGVGLSPFKSFYSEKETFSIAGVSNSWFAPYSRGESVLYRSLIFGYQGAATPLAHLLSSVLRMEEHDETKLGKQIEDRFQALQGLLLQTNPRSTR